MSKELTTKNDNSIDGLIVAAVQSGNSDIVTTMMAVRREIRAEAARAAYYAAMAAFQAEVPAITKSRKVMNKDGRTVRYTYAPLDSILDQIDGLLGKHGFSYRYDIVSNGDGKAYVYCYLSHEQGHTEASRFPLVVDQSGHMNDNQKAASARTYAQRYAFEQVTGICATDDDDARSVDDSKPTPAGRAAETEVDNLI